MNKKLIHAGSVLALISIMAAITYQAEGTQAFSWFLNLEALALVVLGTFCLTSSVFSLREIFTFSPEVLHYAAKSAILMGGLGTLFGVILMLGAATPFDEMPRRLALSLNSILFGILLSKAVLSPAALRAERA